MLQTKLQTPLKIGLITVAAVYFLFTLHAVLTLSWVGEWERLGSTAAFVIYVEDIAATAGMVFRFIASLTAFAAVIVYFATKAFREETTKRILQVILVGEAVYWLGLLPSGVMPIIYFSPSLFSLFSSCIPCLVESTAIPAALIMLVVKLRPAKPTEEAIKWALIAGTAYVLVFWLVNTGIWAATLWDKGVTYLTVHTENLVGFLLTVFGLLVLTFFAARFTKKSHGAESLKELNLKAAGALVTFLGLWSLWNYLTWIFFGQNDLWSAWYAWFLGHNLDLWLLTLPLVGLPLMYSRKNEASYDAGESSNV
jgi:hypothetical protein